MNERKTLARILANALFNMPCAHQGGNPKRERCMTLEEFRPLTRKERADGWDRRPFSAYDPERMCGECRAYWHAEMAAQTLDRMAALEKTL